MKTYPTPTQTLGVLALIGAPFLLLGPLLAQGYPPLSGPWFYGVWAFVYITAWMCSIQGLRLLEATGRSRFGKGILWVITGTLVLADLSNLYALAAPGEKSALFLCLDAFWPLSNLAMLVVGIAVVAAKGLPGWRRYVPLLAGLWLPFTLAVKALMDTGTLLIDAPVVGIYSALAWSLLAVVVGTTKKQASGRMQPSVQTSHRHHLAAGSGVDA
jgi:hypothetical protein